MMEIEAPAAQQSCTDWKQNAWQGVRDCLPTVFGYLSIGFTCGLISKACGLNFWQAVGMSIFIYGGSSQFVAASMIASAAPAVSVIFTIFLVNLRHLFMSAALAPYFQGNSRWRNFAAGMLLTDESFAVASVQAAKEGRIAYAWMTGLNVCAYLNWILATALGFLFGSLVPDYEALGLDFALTAMFIGLLASAAKAMAHWRKSAAIVVVAAVCLVVAVAFVSPNSAVMLAALGGAAAGKVVR